MERNNFGLNPTPEQPLLVGLLVDVSASMKTSIENRTGKTVSRLESLKKALDDLVAKAKQMSTTDSNEKIAPLVRIFAYGFGFGNPIAFLFGRGGSSVRDLLKLTKESTSTVSIDKLANEWASYRKHIESMAGEMGGNTPMGEGFHLILERFDWELKNNKYTAQPVLFVLSDGEPTDVSADQVIEIANQIKQMGVIIVSCYITDAEVVEWGRAYSSPLNHWSDGAKLMFECASIISPDTSFHSYLREHKFTIENDGRIFTQINQSETLSLFMNAILSPLEDGKYVNKEENEMIETVVPAILQRAIDFLFDEIGNILVERRKRQTNKEKSTSSDSSKNTGEAICSREDALKTKIEQSAWSASETEVEHLMKLLEIHKENYYLYKEQYAKYGKLNVPPHVVHGLKEVEEEIVSTTKQLQKVLSGVYKKEIYVAETE